MQRSRIQHISQAAGSADPHTGRKVRYVISIPRLNDRVHIFAVDFWDSDPDSETSPVDMHAKTPLQPQTNDSTGQTEVQIINLGTSINQGAHIQVIAKNKQRSGADMAEQDSSPYNAGAHRVEEPSPSDSRPVKRVMRSTRASTPVSSKTTAPNSRSATSAATQQQTQSATDSSATMNSPLPHTDSSPIPDPQPPPTGPPRVARLENSKVSYFHGWFPIPPQFLFDSSMITSNSSRQSPKAAGSTAEQPTSASAKAPAATPPTTKVVELERDMTPYEGARTIPQWASDLADDIKDHLDSQDLPRRAALKKITAAWIDAAGQGTTHFSPASGVLRVGERASPLWGWWMDARLLSAEQWLFVNEVASKAIKEGYKNVPAKYRGMRVQARV
ncbi:hypothetical protein Slin15195_G107210 [Septoria linicola]|uniref:Uncharacterized protein n=1 Tax=Septoria linicola TaxID=215465 RepID=A0A9Q9B4V6_9PEZI|nr:hypothetical protein Slin14017_G070160 [Septoria linicola]USW57402.1 hypothetical protein Slin15195_G107210 [Septoria linicola]